MVDQIISDKLNSFYGFLLEITDEAFHSDILAAKLENSTKIAMYLFFMTKEKVAENMGKIIEKFKITDHEHIKKLQRYGDLFLDLRAMKYDKKK